MDKNAIQREEVQVVFIFLKVTAKYVMVDSMPFGLVFSQWVNLEKVLPDIYVFI